MTWTSLAQSTGEQQNFKPELENWEEKIAEKMLSKINEKLTSVLSQTVAEIESLKHTVHVLKREAEMNKRTIAKLVRSSDKHSQWTNKKTFNERSPSPTPVRVCNISEPELPEPPSDLTEYEEGESRAERDLDLDERPLKEEEKRKE